MRVGVPHGPLAELPKLDGLMAPHQLVRGRWRCRRDLQLEALLVWGRKPSGRWAEALAQERGLPLWRCEEGFLRSLGSAAEEPSLSLVLDKQGIYYDATCPSELDTLLPKHLSEEQRLRATAVRQQWCQSRLSKVNNAQESPAPREPFVLVVDQSPGDLSLIWGQASTDAFASALHAALANHPGHTVVVKVHPDVVAADGVGHFSADQLADARIQLCGDGGHPTALLEQADAVYVVTSQLGFEALLWDKPVHCFGLPFYAGWGLTCDQLPPPHWRGIPLSLEQLVHAALITYPSYWDPVTEQPSEVETLMSHLALQRQELLSRPELLVACGMKRWKKPALSRFLRGPRGSQLLFRSRRTRQLPAGATAVVWGRPRRRPEGPCWQLEDGFLRSVGLGANLIQPASWVLDRSGIYYDATTPSDLETFLANHAFSAAERQRAAAFRHDLLAAGLTKYNLQAEPWQPPEEAKGRRVQLVVGQVPRDASLRFGVPEDAEVRSNAQLLEAVRREFPNDYILYKPHPDVVAGLRHGGPDESLCAASADAVLCHGDMAQLLTAVDQVHVLTSLTGFEALLREVPVQVYGLPFYAGWGLSDDVLHCPRRGRPLQLDELVYGALIHYPSYLCQRSGGLISPEQALLQLLALKQQGPPQLSIKQKLHSRWRPLLETLEAWWRR